MQDYYDFQYQLTEEEVFLGLKKSGVYKSSGKRALIETIILFVFFGAFLASFIYRQQIFDIGMAILTLGIAVALYVVPRFDMKKQSKAAQKDIHIRIYPERLCVYGQNHIDLVFDDVEKSGKPVAKVTYLGDEEMFCVRVKSGGLILIPKRTIPEIQREAVTELLRNQIR